MNILKISNVTKSFGGNKVINNLNMALKKGVITTFIGPNGAGKTTAFNLITGYISPDKGEIFYNEEKISHLPPYKIAKSGIMRSFQNLRLFNGLTVLENVLLAEQNHPGEKLSNLFFFPNRSKKGELRTIEKAYNVLEQVDLINKKDIPVKNLSYGEMKLLALARIIMAESEVILLDEVLAGLDRQSIEDIINVIFKLKEMQKTICIIEHNVEVLKEVSDHVIFLHQGSVIAEGKIDQLLQNKELTELYFGNPVSERGVSANAT
ncbi:ABC transporter ATP-binding protein [Bacillus sp. Marseille-P3661]|uniref:ABC transporter ATP-binding protein n=1 Tax=Bacillus sp. Marseille-P3661 TaxID=1936234 RepID=UPI000C846B96|nr:ABC transporter ATP-binding protein [Bacillus sp. Marseille-P3661]